MHTLNILSLNVNGLNSAVKQTHVLEYLHRKYTREFPRGRRARESRGRRACVGCEQRE